MPTLSHEGPLLLFRECPRLLSMLVEDFLGAPLPAHRTLRVQEADFTQLTATEYRADLVVTAEDDGPVLGLVVEVQRSVEARKRFVWPLYVAALHAKLECPVWLVVVTHDQRVVRWASEPIATFQPGSSFVPIVVGPDRIPRVGSGEEAKRFPELAVLSAVIHGNEKGGEKLAAAAVAGLSAVADEERARLYFRLLEQEMENRGYEYQSDFARRYVAEGRVEGRVEGARALLLRVIARRGLDLPAGLRERIESEGDLERLERWHDAAVTATCADEIIDA